MTMLDNKCDVCDIGEAIGVASTIIPYSCAYCAECARRDAQPMLVFICIFDDVGTDIDQITVPDIETFCDGRYMTYREWAPLHAARETPP